ncbi:secretory lipase-domain-containing protein [Chlamydoabsidia padenii]|nr:secretory lipase-domain-containing protein [Chlamydoabsidia padenii]
MTLSLFLLIWATLVSCAQIKPSEDPFYTVTPEFEKTTPGTILRSRPLPLSTSFTLFPTYPRNIKGAYQILYRTTDALGNATAAVTTILVPHNADPKKLVSYQVIQDSTGIDCGFSYKIQNPITKADIVPQVETFFMDVLLQRGWYVAAPDYEGLDSMFGVGRMAGHAVLDGLRAVLASGEFTGVDPKAQTQLWGYSGGALASGWAAQLHQAYAPEIDIVGAILGGTPVDINATVAIVDGTRYSGVAISGILGVAKQYKAFRDHMDENLKPDMRQAFYNVSKLCYGTILQDYGFQDLKTYFIIPDYANHPSLVPAVEANQMGRDGIVPTIPIFAYHAEHDHVSPYQAAKTIFDGWCQGGAYVDLLTETSEDHSQLLFAAVPDAILFMEKRFSGAPVPSTCSARSTSNAYLDPGAIKVRNNNNHNVEI